MNFQGKDDGICGNTVCEVREDERKKSGSKFGVE